MRDRTETVRLPKMTSHIHRKPVGPQPPAGAPPPPPYRIHNPPTSSDIPAGIRHAPTAPNLSSIDSTPAEPKRTTLTKQAPPLKPSSRRSSVNAEASYLADAGYLSDNGSPRTRRESNDAGRRRSGSYQSPRPAKGGYPEPLTKASQTMPTDDARGRSVSAQVPGTTRRTSSSANRVTSSPAHPGQSPSRGRLRRSWLPGGRSRSNSIDPLRGQGPSEKSFAWVMSDGSNAEYNHSFLASGDKVPELWNEAGTVSVYLFFKGSGRYPQFKVPEFTVSSSMVFSELIQNERGSPTSRQRGRSFDGRGLSVHDAARFMSPTGSPTPSDPSDVRLYVPMAPPPSVPGQEPQIDMERMIAVRNLFAFLTGQPLVGTKARPTVFLAFLQIAALLQEFGFTSADGTTFGDAVDMSFSFYVDQLGLADCRSSREKTLEALVLGERMRSPDLYSEAFAHAAGKYAAIMDLQLPLFDQVSAHTRQQLERAHLDLVNRQHNVNEHLESFDFPALFSGIANSNAYSELKAVRFKVWRASYNKMRQFVLSYYKSSFGNWPPKASSKKNPFAESGLNRLVLKMLYSDMCALYDLVVDRENKTSRVIDEVPTISTSTNKMTMSALRNMLSENDRSRPPVLPPIPYDTPKLPALTSVMANYNKLSEKEQYKVDKKLKEHELILVLNKGYNYDTNAIKLPFLDAFKDFELKEARGKMGPDLADQRIGYWLFLYVVVQSLPMLIVDAPGLKFTDGTEYFLCEPPMGNYPWDEDKQVRKAWYNVAGGSGIVELSTDTILFSVEATYNRSHCWLAAKVWEGEEGADAAPPHEPVMSPLAPPPLLIGDSDGGILGSPPPISGTPPAAIDSPQLTLRPRNMSPAAHRASHVHRSSMLMGLEPVPSGMDGQGGPGGVMGSQSNLSLRSLSAGNLAALNTHPNRASTLPVSQSSSTTGGTSGATFDDILGGSTEDKKPAPKKKSRFF